MFIINMLYDPYYIMNEQNLVFVFFFLQYKSIILFYIDLKHVTKSNFVIYYYTFYHRYLISMHFILGLY